METMLLEKKLPKVIAGPVNLNTALNTGNRVDMKNVKRVTFLIILGAGTTTANHSLQLKQSNAASAGTTKALSVQNPYYHKINAATKFTRVDPGSATDTYDVHALAGDNVAVFALEVLAEQLDRDNGFRYVSLDIPQPGGAQIGTVLAFADHEFGPAYDQVV